MITGDSGCGKSSLLRAIAGLWHSGSGVIQHPPFDDVFFLPQQPYMQVGTLRSQLIYPGTETTLSDDKLRDILNEVHLPELAERVGYNSKSSFNIAFKKYTQKTPSEYRKSFNIQ